MGRRLPTRSLAAVLIFLHVAARAAALAPDAAAAFVSAAGVTAAPAAVTAAPTKLDFETADAVALQCAYTSSDNVSSSEMCDSTNPIHYCYTLFRRSNATGSYEVYLRGCWSGGGPVCLTHARSSADRAACLRQAISDVDHMFCCCIGDMCNVNARPLAPVVEAIVEPSPVGDSVGEQLEEPRNLALYTAFPGCVLLIIAALSYVNRKRRRDVLTQRMVDEADDKSAADVGPTIHPLDDVTLDERVGEGRFGTVWKGRHNNSAPVAVKIFRAGERQSWLNEVDVYNLPQMLHANVLTFIGIRQETSTPSGLPEYWLVTRWHELGSLYDYLRLHGTVSYYQLLQLADSIAKGVMHLHTEAPATRYEMYKPAMAHRDIKSKNIIVKGHTTACIADFGLAIKFEPGASVGTAHSQVGTCRYMSPEVLEGAISFDQEAFQRIDIYAVALVLWELLSRTADCQPFAECRLPFEELVGPNPSLLVMQEVVVNQKHRPPIKDGWRTDPRLATFVATLEECWDTDSDARLSASTMHERFQHLISAYFPDKADGRHELDEQVTPLRRNTATIVEIETMQQVV